MTEEFGPVVHAPLLEPVIVSLYPFPYIFSTVCAFLNLVLYPFMLFRHSL